MNEETFIETPMASSQPEPTVVVSAQRRYGRSRRAWLVWLAGAVLAGLILLALIGPVFLRSPSTQDLSAAFVSPFSHANGHFFCLGSDELGRDELARVLGGLRTSLAIVALAALVGCAVGTLLGVAAGYGPRWMDDLVMRMVDIQMSVPAVLFVLMVVAIFKASFWTIVIVLGLAIWMTFARVVRAEVLSLKERDMILAIRSLGASRRRVVVRHILPSVAAPILIIATLQISSLIFAEAALGYLGFGVPPPTPTLGGMIADGQGVMTTGTWWPVLVPGLAIVLVIATTTVLGDWLRDRLDPNTGK